MVHQQAPHQHMSRRCILGLYVHWLSLCNACCVVANNLALSVGFYCVFFSLSQRPSNLCCRTTPDAFASVESLLLSPLSPPSRTSCTPPSPHLVLLSPLHIWRTVPCLHGTASYSSSPVSALTRSGRPCVAAATRTPRTRGPPPTACGVEMHALLTPTATNNNYLRCRPDSDMLMIHVLLQIFFVCACDGTCAKGLRGASRRTGLSVLARPGDRHRHSDAPSSACSPGSMGSHSCRSMMRPPVDFDAHRHVGLN